MLVNDEAGQNLDDSFSISGEVGAVDREEGVKLSGASEGQDGVKKLSNGALFG